MHAPLGRRLASCLVSDGAHAACARSIRVPMDCMAMHLFCARDRFRGTARQGCCGRGGLHYAPRGCLHSEASVGIDWMLPRNRSVIANTPRNTQPYCSQSSEALQTRSWRRRYPCKRPCGALASSRLPLLLLLRYLAAQPGLPGHLWRAGTASPAWLCFSNARLIILGRAMHNRKERTGLGRLEELRGAREAAAFRLWGCAVCVVRACACRSPLA